MGERAVIWSSRLRCAIKFNDTDVCLNRLKCLSVALVEQSAIRPRSKVRNGIFLPLLHNIMTSSCSLVNSFIPRNL